MTAEWGMLIIGLIPWVLLMVWIGKKVSPAIGRYFVRIFAARKEFRNLVNSYAISDKYARHYKKKYKDIEKS